MARSYRLGPARRAGNMVMTAMIRLGIGGKGSYLLTTTGRKSGLRRTTPVTLVSEGGQRWLVAPYGRVGWVHNVRANPVISVRRGGSSEELRAVEVDADAAGPVLKRYVTGVPITAPYFDARAEDPVGKFTAEADRHPVFRLSAPAGAG